MSAEATTTPAAGRERTRVQLCGRLSIELDGEQRVDRLRGRQVPLLFAYLVLHRERAVARDELAVALWPDSPPRFQDAALRTLLSRLRSALGPDAVVGRDEIGLALPEPVWIDIEAATAQVAAGFTALERRDARAAWALAQVPLNIAARGLLPGVQAAWLETGRRELAELRLQALELIGRAGLSLGGTQLASVERAGRALIELERYRESGYVLLMEALAAEGNLAEGLRVYERLRALLRDELGTAPSREAIAVHERLLSPGGASGASGAATGGPDAGRATDDEAVALPALLRAAAAGPLIGRHAEMAALRRWWQEGPERMLLLSGEAGTGKSRLQAELAAEAHGAGAVVLAGRSPEETLAPYQTFLEAIGTWAFQAPLEQLRAVVRRCGDSAADVARLIPEIRRRLAELPAAPPSDPETDRYRMFEGVAVMLGELAASGRLLIVLDDLHWSARPTQLLLRHLLRSPQAARLRLLGASRTGEEGSVALAATLTPLRRERLVVGLDLGGLPPEDAARLVRARAGGTPSAALQAALYEETDGNPFFIEELVRHLRDTGLSPAEAAVSDLRRAGPPDDVRDLVGRRLERLSADAREWLAGAAVLGRGFEAAVLEALLGFDEDRFLDALEEALAARLVLEVPGTPGEYQFAHALIREALYGSMSSARRARIHHRAGRALEAREESASMAALAHHFTNAGGAGDAERAITYALAAGTEATAVLAHEEAADHLARALQALDRSGSPDPGRRAGVLLELAEARLRAGERLEAWPVFLQAAELAASLGDREALIRAALGASRRFIQPPGLVEPELIALLDQAVAATEGERSLTRVRLLAQLCAALYFSPRRDEMRRLGAEATAIAAELIDAEAAALAASARRRAWWGPGRLDRRLADSTMLLRSATAAGALELTLQGHAWLLVDLLEAGDRTAVEAQIDAFALAAESLRQPLYSWNLAVWRAMLALLDGRLAEAERLADDALAVGIRPEQLTATQYHLTQLYAIWREQLRGEELLTRLRAMPDGRSDRATWRLGVGLLDCDLGRTEPAAATLAALVGPGGIDVALDGDWLAVVSLLAEIAAELGDAARAGVIYEALRPLAGSVLVIGVGTVCGGATARHLGRLALTLGQRERAVEHLQRAVEVNAALRAPVALAHAQVDLARALGAGPRGVELLAAAARTAEQLGLGLVARRAAAAREAASAAG